MEKQIFTIGYTIPTFDENDVDFYEESSLMDADILVISPDSLRPKGHWVSFSSTDGGCYNVEASRAYKDNLARLKKEIGDHLNAGKSVFILLTKKEEYSLAVSVSTEKKGQTLYSTEIYDNYNFLPVKIGTLTSASGKHIEFLGDPTFSDFFKNFKKYLEYHLYIENVTAGKAIFTGKDRTKILGAIYKVKAGNLVLLPFIKYDEDKFIEYPEEDEKGYWTKEAEKFGKSLFQAFVNIDKSLRESAENTPPPDWSAEENFQLAEEGTLKKKLEAKAKEIEGLILEKNELLTRIALEGKLRDLLFEKGKNLENAITMALEILGYKAENYNDGNLELDHVIVSPEGDRFIGEAEGKDTSAVNIDKLRQLLVNIHEDLQREEIESPAVGILFGNGFRLVNPLGRGEQFTAKCITTAKSSNCILIRTTDLFQVAKYVKESKDDAFAKSSRDAIKLSIGRIVQFPILPSAQDASK